MAGVGPAPKQHHQRERDTKRRQSDAVTITRDGALRGPEIADATHRADWPVEVVSWWEDWRASPQAALFEDTDWRRLALLAPIIAAYVRRPSAASLSEIRLNEERLGALYVDRLRAKIRVEEESGSDLASVSSIEESRASARSRLQGEE